MTVAATKPELERVLGASRDGFRLAQVTGSEARDWSDADGSLRHRSGGFFSCVGVKAPHGDRLLMYQPQSAITGLIRSNEKKQERYLLQARAEPGCIGSAQFGPTVQSTPANFQKVHGGKAPPYVDRFLAGQISDALVDDTAQLDLGERYLHKTKRSMLLESDRDDHEVADANYVWATVPAIREGLATDAFFNIDLRSIFAVADWAADPAEDRLGPASEAVAQSLRVAVRASVLGAIAAEMASGQRRARILFPLQELENWTRSDHGWRETVPWQGFAVEFYAVQTRFREVNAWVQPLMNSRSAGHAVLACRMRRGILEVFVKVASESGILGRVLAPSFLRYPGSHAEPPEWIAARAYSPWVHTRESDEGGRFLQDATDYELVWLDEGDHMLGQGHWITISELKALLRQSNTAAIQLRCLTSLLLVAADP